MGGSAGGVCEHDGMMECQQECVTELVVRRCFSGVFFFQAEDGIRDLVRSRGLGDVYKRQLQRQGLSHFDSWASTFGETATAIELAPEGTGYRALSLIHI